MKTKKKNLLSPSEAVFKSIATLGFIGYLPYAPGTFGSALGLITFFLFNPSLHAHLLIIILGTLIGIYTSSVAELVLKEKDSKKIVIDEFIGFYVAVLFIPRTPGFLITAFILFRFFDILKPLAIDKLEKALSKGRGIMADDIMAGIYANIVLQIWILIFRQ